MSLGYVRSLIIEQLVHCKNRQITDREQKKPLNLSFPVSTKTLKNAKVNML